MKDSGQNCPRLNSLRLQKSSLLYISPTVVGATWAHHRVITAHRLHFGLGLPAGRGTNMLVCVALEFWRPVCMTLWFLRETVETGR